VRAFILKALIVAVALAGAFLPLPEVLVERYYSSGVYPPLQRALTSAGNHVAVPVFDIVLAVTLLALFVLLLRRRRIMNVLALLACVWLVFLLAWGLNYRRVPLVERLALAPEPPSRAERAEAMFAMAVEELNTRAASAHATPWPSFHDLAPQLAPAFARIQEDLGLPGGAVPGRPKISRLSPFFRLAAVDGFTNPFLLETIVNPAVLPIERPHVLAHEWAHLTGLADESEASFFAWLACLRAGGQSRYSGWLGVYHRLAAAIPRPRAQAIDRRLGDVPREDLRAMAVRVREASPAVRRATEATYDRYLRANRVDLGIASYDAVVNLIISADLTDEFVPRLRP
jgi:hypothetical protein